MDPVSVEITVGRPREEVFDYLADIANHLEFTDHYLTDFHLTREDTVGLGAGARFRVNAPLQRFSWMGVRLVEVDRPWRIVEAGSGGKYNRTRAMIVFTLEPAFERRDAGRDEHRDGAGDDHRPPDGKAGGAKLDPPTAPPRAAPAAVDPRGRDASRGPRDGRRWVVAH